MFDWQIGISDAHTSPVLLVSEVGSAITHSLPHILPSEKNPGAPGSERQVRAAKLTTAQGLSRLCPPFLSLPPRKAAALRNSGGA